MKWVIIALLTTAALLLLDRIALLMERKGWIFYRHRKSSPGTRASAALALQSMLEPDRRHMTEAIRKNDEDREFAEDDLD